MFNYASVAEMEYARRLGRRSRKGSEVQILSEAPEWNLAVVNQPRSGRAEGTPTLFRSFSPMNSDSRLRRDGGFFRQETGASQRFLWHRPFSQKGLYPVRFR